MQSDSNTKTIGGSTYEVFMLPATIGFDMFMDLARIVGPAIGVVFDGADLKDIESVGDLAFTGDVFEKAARQIFQAEEKETVKATIQKLAAHTQVDGKKLSEVFETHFQGKIGKLSKWFVFALEVNFKDFLDVSRTSLGRAIAAKAGEAEKE